MGSAMAIAGGEANYHLCLKASDLASCGVLASLLHAGKA